MANRYAIASGNYSNPAIWDGGLGVPTSADVVRPSGFVIDVDGNFIANQFRNDASAPALANGRFNLLNGSSLTGLNTTAFSYVTSGAGFITFSLAAGNSATLNGNINFSNRISSNPLTHSGGGTLTINGNVTSTGASLSGVGGAIWFSGAGNLNINGNVTGGGANGGSPADLISHAGAGTINVVGNVASGAFTGWNDRVFVLTGTGNLNITGNVTGVNSGSPSALSSPAIQHSGSGTVCVIGNVYGGTSANGNAIYSPGNNVTKVIGNLYGSGAQAFIGVHPMAKLVLHGVSYQTDLGVGGYGNILIHPTDEVFQEFRTSLSGVVGSARRLYSGGTNLGQPIPANVRNGTIFGASGEYTGTCYVPEAQYVSQGVLVDNTVGTLISATSTDISNLQTHGDANWAGSGFTDTETKQIRYRLGVDGTTEAPSTNSPNITGVTLAANQDVRNVLGTLSATALTNIKSKVDESLSDLGLTSVRCGYLDKLNVSSIATQADVLAINWSASRRILLVTSSSFEIPDDVDTYKIRLLTFNPDGEPETPSVYSLTATSNSGSKTARLSSATVVDVGVIEWTYEVQSTDDSEQLTIEAEVTLADGDFLAATYPNVVNAVSDSFTISDRNMLTALYNDNPKLVAVYNKLPSAMYLLGTSSSNGSGYSILTSGDVVAASQSGSSTALSSFGAAKEDTSQSIKTTVEAISTWTGTISTTITSISSTLSTLAGKFTGITFVRDWLRLLSRSDSNYSGKATALTELNEGTTNGSYNNETHSNQSIITNLDNLDVDASVSVIIPGGFLQRRRAVHKTIDLYVGETGSMAFTVWSPENTPLRLDAVGGYTFRLEENSVVIYTTSITVSGDDLNTVNLPLGDICEEAKRGLVFTLRESTSNQLVLKGELNIREAP